MYTIETVVREIKGEKKEQKMLFGTGRLTNDPPQVKVVGQNGVKVMRGSKDHSFAIAFPDPSLGKDNNGRTKSKFFNVSIWEKNAEVLARLGYKGQPIEVFGRIETKSYNGNEYEELTIERFEVKKYKPKEEEDSDTGKNSVSTQTDSTQADSAQTGSTQIGSVQAGTDGTSVQDPNFENGKPLFISDDDIPF
ncbi:single-stranded DNA-binding protein (plasmid) [Brevibacillus halotolerans]|nr:single-stranded DNA-binding protein [Brevibacillus halotolerans]